jgi:hypothetical protein
VQQPLPVLSSAPLMSLLLLLWLMALTRTWKGSASCLYLIWEVVHLISPSLIWVEKTNSHLVDHLADEFKRKSKKDVWDNPKALRCLRTAADGGKCTVTSSTEASIEIRTEYEGIDFNTNISQALTSSSQLQSLWKEHWKTQNWIRD